MPGRTAGADRRSETGVPYEIPLGRDGPSAGILLDVTPPQGPPSASSRRAGTWLAASGLLVLATGIWGLARDYGPIAQPFYAYGWWGAILILDGACALKRGSSLLTSRPRHVLRMVLWSTSFWFFFELLNVRYQNWYYVGVFAPRDTLEQAWGALFVVACFSTVFIGLFEMSEALTAFGAFRSWRIRPRPLPRWAPSAVQALGAAMVAASLLFPRYLAPLIWGSLTFIIDPVNYRRGARSVLRDVESGDLGAFARTFAAGLLCGLLWESMNFHAPQKWIYTVRGLENLKLFEMPVLGFLGFPALAFDAVTAYAFISWRFHGNEPWEAPGDLSYRIEPRPAWPRPAFAATVPVHILFWGAVNTLVIGVNIGSFELRLSDLPALSQAQVAALAAAGVDRPGRLLDVAADPRRMEELRSIVGASPADLDAAVDQARLYSLKGIGAEHGRLLEKGGVRTVGDLSSRDPERLEKELLTISTGWGARPPRLEMVRVWVTAARAQFRDRARENGTERRVQ